jgi:5-methyltetrahydropteroyltriglutamate--homocysteine methyltransferase
MGGGHLAQGIKDICVQSSASLQHLPYNKELETELPAELVSRLSFAKQKLGEIVAAAKGAKPSGGSLKAALPTVSACPDAPGSPSPAWTAPDSPIFSILSLPQRA